jgi:uridine kinase
MATPAKPFVTNKKRKLDSSASEAKLEKNGDLHRRTFRFALSLASVTAFPERQLVGGQAISHAYWYRFEDGTALTAADAEKLQLAITDLVKKDSAIEVETRGYQEVFDMLEATKQTYATALLSTNCRHQVQVHSCEGQLRLYLHPLLESLGQLGQLGAFELRPYRNGLIAIYDTVKYVDQPRIADSFENHAEWSNTTGVRCLGHVNQLQLKGVKAMNEFMLHAEFRQEDKLSDIARMIEERGRGEDAVRVLCIAGPTSSGKTTFATKLAMYLRNKGFHAQALSVDHYYLSLPDQPKFKVRGERKDVDYDSIEAMDIDLVGKHVTALINGEKIEAPKYNFASGLREEKGHPFELRKGGILVLEGIHALNPEYSRGVPQQNVFRIYISPLTTLQVDDFNAVKTTSHRCLRRLCRDNKFRGYTAHRVLEMWPKVRAGEHLYIFPHQNNADYVMNSCSEYELPVLKRYVRPLLSSVYPSENVFAHCQELSSLISNISSWSDHGVPSTALLREFIGDGAFDCH